MPLLKDPESVLIVCLRRLGDVLLTTPLAASLQARWPQVQVHWLVFDSAEGILEDNPAAQRVIAIPQKLGARGMLSIIERIFMQYDLALSSQAGDRPSFFARLAGKYAITFQAKSRGARIRDRLFSATVPHSDAHRIDHVLSLLKPLNIEPKLQMSTPAPDFSYAKTLGSQPYVVFHPGAAFRYKAWTKEGWQTLTKQCINHGLSIVVTGGPGLSEREYLDEIFDGLPVRRADGVLSWPQLTGVLLSADRYAGVDTSVTHLAAACGVRGLAIFGPTDPRLWGPRAQGGSLSIQVVSNRLPCVPCQQEGCDRHVDSHSLCLDSLGVDTVWAELSAGRSLTQVEKTSDKLHAS